MATESPPTKKFNNLILDEQLYNNESWQPNDTYMSKLFSNFYTSKLQG